MLRTKTTILSNTARRHYRSSTIPWFNWEQVAALPCFSKQQLDIHQKHYQACENNCDYYIDPSTGYQVKTRLEHLKRGSYINILLVSGHEISIPSSNNNDSSSEKEVSSPLSMSLSSLHKTRTYTNFLQNATTTAPTTINDQGYLSSSERRYSDDEICFPLDDFPEAQNRRDTSSSSGIEGDIATSEIDFSIGFDVMDDNDLISLDENEQYVDSSDESNVVDDRNEFGRPYFQQKLQKTDYDVEDDNERQTRTEFLNSFNSSTNTLSANHFSLYADENTDETNNICRSKSISITHSSGRQKIAKNVSKKVVRFADVMGLDLESVRYMTPPDQSILSIIHDCIKTKLEQLKIIRNDVSNNFYLKSKSFIQPINVTQHVYDRQVLLEYLYTKDLSAFGTIRVNNICYEKYVFVRYTLDNWLTYNDLSTIYSQYNRDDNTDSYIFELKVPDEVLSSTPPPTTILFAVCYSTTNQEYWDNNFNCNYQIEIHQH
ncbi:unnamed protein product [Didymodactylos carnosus]|uniref:CBM21 domain-containing protein n=1 Tax=Didymodactylos carnosus TaxID=1234261 RepID=A0A813XZM5_9BILA|nr:unnamed protein product [Didymodactylos carnosus]CAF3664875.1 unnamed protein product [Didymodactylos carnosus]